MTECDAPISSAPVAGPDDFDFWLGSWVASWGDGAQGRNVITKTYDGKVVEERFDGRPGAEFQGMSVNVYELPVRDGCRRGSTTRGTTSRSRAPCATAT
jgi:hypothetical protein